MVDDDVELCALITEYLGGHGFRVDAVHDGSAGLRAASRASDLVILDVMLPVLDGFEVLRQLRQAIECAGHHADRARRGTRPRRGFGKASTTTW